MCGTTEYDQVAVNSLQRHRSYAKALTGTFCFIGLSQTHKLSNNEGTTRASSGMFQA